MNSADINNLILSGGLFILVFLMYFFAHIFLLHKLSKKYEQAEIIINNPQLFTTSTLLGVIAFCSTYLPHTYPDFAMFFMYACAISTAIIVQINRNVISIKE